MRISFISKVTRIHKAVTVANNTSLCSSILVVFLKFTSVDLAEISHMNTKEFVPVTEPARLPGSYEEALTPGASAENAILDIFEIFSLGQIILVYSKKAFAWQQAILSTSTTFYQIYAWS